MSKTDVNDYSRFNNIDDNSDEETKDSKSGKVETKTILERLADAKKFKDVGNEYFKNNEYNAARNNYEKGLEELKEFKDKDNNSSNQEKLLKNLPEAFGNEIMQIFLSFYSNLSLIASKEDNHLMTIHYCHNALSFDSNHFKSLFRRAIAYKAINELDKSKKDLLKCQSLEPNNAMVKKSLQEITVMLKDHQKKEKNLFSNIFNSKTSMYDDREKERLLKLQEKEELERKEKEEWENSNQRRIENNESEETFEQWKERITKEKKDAETFSSSSSENDEEKSSRKREKAPKKVSDNNAAKTAKQSDSTTDEKDLEYDEEEAKIIAETKAKGYCYFKDDIKKAEAQLRSITPQTPNSMESTSNKLPIDSSSQHQSDASAANNTEGVTTSSWNYAGTWEERNMTDLVKGKLTEIFTDRIHQRKSSDLSREISAKIAKVEKLEGDAQIVMTRGKKRHLYDFNAKLDFLVEIKENNEKSEEKPKSYKGSYLLNEIVPNSAFDEFQIQFKKSSHNPEILQSAKDLLEIIKSEIQSFETEFKSL